MGFNPYVTNVMRGHHPMYPLVGAGRIDILAHHISPAVFADGRRNQVENLVVSVGSRSQPGLEAPQWKVPFTTSPREIRSFAGPDVHLAGWGVFFSGVLLVSLGMWVGRGGWRRAPAAAGFAALAVVVTVLVNPYAWWARFAPQLALLPVFLLLPFLVEGAARWPRRIAVVLCGLLVLDGAINAGCAVLASAVPTLRMHRVLKQIAAECGPGQYLAYPVAGDMPYHYEVFSGYRGVEIEGAGEGVAIPEGARSYMFGVSWGRVRMVRVGGCR